MAILSILLLATPLFAGDQDTVITRKTHTPAITIGDRDIPARESTQTIWIHGKDRLRIEEGDRTTIVRLDQKKAFLLNNKEKTVAEVALPFDMSKYMPEGFGNRGAGSRPASDVTVTPTDETKRINNWTAKKYKISRSGSFGGSTQEIWATTETGVDATALRELMAMVPAMRPGDGDAMKKVEGFVVLSETTRSMGGEEIKTTESVASIEKKEPAAGAYDVPEDYKKVDFDPRSMMGGGGRGGRRGPGGEGAASRPGRGGRRGPGGEGAGSRPAKEND
jgi:hypothetical protein